MAREFLKGVKSENRLSKVRLIMPNDPVIGGQPSDNADEFTSNTPFLDLACSIQYSITQAANANTAAKNADTKAGTAQNTANTANTAAKNADTKAVAAQKTADEAKTAAATANSKAVAAQKTADEAKTAAATADGKAVAAQNTANTANTAAKNADTKAANAQTTATGAKTAADNAQKKANQVPNPLLDQLPIGTSGAAFKLITLADLKTKLGVPAKTNVVQTTGTSTTAAMSQKAVTDISFGVNQKWQNLTTSRLLATEYTNTTSKSIEVLIALIGGNGNKKFRIYVDGILLVEPGQTTTIQQSLLNFTVPAGAKYKVETDVYTVSDWSELR